VNTAGTEATRTLFDDWASTYDATVRETFGHMSGISFDDFLGRICEALAPAPGARVLEVAVGTAALASAVVRRGAAGVHVVGVDASPRMLEVARVNVEAAGLGEAIALQEADATALPFPDASFDGVITSNALHHMDVPKAIAGIAR